MLANKSIACKPATRAFRADRRAVACCASSFISDKFKATAAAVILASGLSAAPAFADGVSIVNLTSGAVVSSPVHLDFAVEGLAVKPAAEGLVPGTGHHHLIIDAPAPEEGAAIPFDDAHRHFGKGQTGADLELAPGTHSLTLQFANAKHESYGPAFAATVTVTVK